METLDPSLLDRLSGNTGHLLVYLIVVCVVGFLSSAVTELVKAMMFSKRRKDEEGTRESMKCRWNEVNQDWTRKYECTADCETEHRRKGKENGNF